MGRGVLIVDVVAWIVTLSPTFPLRTAEPVRSTTPEPSEPSHVVVERMAPAPRCSPAQPVEEAEGGERLEDRRPTMLKLMEEAMTAT